MESDIMLKIIKRIEPSTDANSRNMNFLAVRQEWEHARTKAVAAR
jgi:hypothetical protein